jgi:hypothetical protein
MPSTVRPDHPAIQPVVAAIRAISNNPYEQIVMVNDVTHLLVDYDDDERVYGRLEFHATLDEMIARRRQAGWIYLRDDCDGRAVFAAHLLSALGIPWHFEASYWKRHAWIVAKVDGKEYDLLELRESAPETADMAYRTFGHFFVRKTHQPPFFHWRRAWLERTNADIEIGKRLGLLELDSAPGALHERFATDWTRIHPEGTQSPEDKRVYTASAAGFPYGEALHPMIADKLQLADTATDSSAAPSSGARGPLTSSAAK